MFAQHAPQLRFLDLRRDRRHHLGRELVLQLEEVARLAGQPIAPDRRARFAVRQLG
jgi:hypothetical protein